MEAVHRVHSQRTMYPVSLGTPAVALVKRSSSFSQPSSPKSRTSMSMTWPAFSTVWRVATATSDVPVNEAVKATRNLVEGIEGIVPLSKSKGIEAAKTVTPASDACDSSLGDDQRWRDARHSTSVPIEFSICSLHEDGAHAASIECRTICPCTPTRLTL